MGIDRPKNIPMVDEFPPPREGQEKHKRIGVRISNAGYWDLYRSFNTDEG
jgi:hypothetical protein